MHTVWFYSSVGLEHLTVNQGAGGSIPPRTVYVYIANVAQYGRAVAF